MTVGELKRFLEEVDDDVIVATDRYNSGYGGLFELNEGRVISASQRPSGRGYEEDGDGKVRLLELG